MGSESRYQIKYFQTTQNPSSGTVSQPRPIPSKFKLMKIASTPTQYVVNRQYSVLIASWQLNFTAKFHFSEIVLGNPN